MPCGANTDYGDADYQRQKKMAEQIDLLTKQIERINQSRNQPTSCKPPSDGSFGLIGMIESPSLFRQGLLQEVAENTAKSMLNPQPRENKEMRLLCDVLNHLEQTDNFDSVISVCKYTTEIKEWWKQHCKEDADRWYKHYKDKYPNFSKDEIAKMVREGVLEDI